MQIAAATIRNRPGANKPGGWVVQRMGQAPPAPSGRKRQGAQSANALLNWASQGQRRGRCKVRRRALRVSRPAREKNRRRRVLVVTISHRDRCAPSSVPGCEPSLDGQPGGVGGEPEGRWFSPTPYFRSRMAFSTGVAAMVGLQIQGVPVPVGDRRDSCRRRRGPVGTRARASPAGR